MSLVEEFQSWRVETDGYNIDSIAELLNKKLVADPELCRTLPDSILQDCEQRKFLKCYKQVSAGVLKHCSAHETSPACNWITTTLPTTTATPTTITTTTTIPTTTSSNLTTIIISGIIGGIFVLVLVMAFVMFCRRKQTSDPQGSNDLESNAGGKKKKKKGETSGTSGTTGTNGTTVTTEAATKKSKTKNLKKEKKNKRKRQELVALGSSFIFRKI